VSSGADTLSKHAGLIGAVALVVGALTGEAKAKVVQYEINGQLYSYDTDDRPLAEKAQRLIEAARAAEAAKAQAAAERARFPLVNLLGSPAQREAVQAQARLQQIIPEAHQAASAAPEPVNSSRMVRRPVRSGVDAEAKRVDPEVKAELGATRARRQAAGTATAKPEGVEPAADGTASDPRQMGVVFSSSIGSSGAQKPALRAITFDLGSGIKTVQMTDGTLHEEALDSSTLSKLSSIEPAAEDLTSFIEQVRTSYGEGTRAKESSVKGAARN